MLHKLISLSISLPLLVPAASLGGPYLYRFESIFVVYNSIFEDEVSQVLEVKVLLVSGRGNREFVVQSFLSISSWEGLGLCYLRRRMDE